VDKEEAWCEQGPTHHCALGHHAGTLGKVARLLGLEFVEVGQWRLEGMPQCPS
jgi:L-arabinose isomerase